MSIFENKAVIAEIDALGNGSGDLSRLDLLCAPDIVNHALAADRPQGIEGPRQFLVAASRHQHPADGSSPSSSPKPTSSCSSPSRIALGRGPIPRL
jgi:hypothetical protein